MAKNHYGVTVDKSIPIGGVIHNTNQAEWLIEEFYDGVDLDYENHIAECKECQNDLDCEIVEYWDFSKSTILIGQWIKNEDNLWEADKTGQFAAIAGEIYTQIIWSRFVSKTNLCSPCYPGQGDLGNNGEYLTYDLPPDLYGDWLMHEITELMEA